MCRRRGRFAHAISGASLIVALQLRPEAARLFLREISSRGTSGTVSPLRRLESPDLASVRRVLALVREAGAGVAPLDPRSTDPVLSTFFTIDVPDAASASSLAAALLDLPAVEAAYVKPSDETPPA